MYLFQKYFRTMSDRNGDLSLAGEGKLNHFKTEKSIVGNEFSFNVRTRSKLTNNFHFILKVEGNDLYHS